MKINVFKTIKIFIATNPTDTADKAMKELLSVTNITTTNSTNIVTQDYMHNEGEQTKIATGGARSFTVACDYDTEDDLHTYLWSLSQSSPLNYNNQYIVIEHSGLGVATKYLFGKSLIEFTATPSSGAANELVKLELNLHPQDDRWVISETKPAWFPDPAVTE